MSGSSWTTTSSWLSQSLRPFLCSSSVCSCHLFLISSASVRHLPLLCPLLCLFLHEVFPWYLQFSFKRSLIFPILFFPPIFVTITLSFTDLNYGHFLKFHPQLLSPFIHSLLWVQLFSMLTYFKPILDPSCSPVFSYQPEAHIFNCFLTLLCYSRFTSLRA